MTTTTATNGRLCNQIIRNLATSFVAEKHLLHVTYASHAKMKELGIDLYVGTTRWPTTTILTDDTYEEILNARSPIQSNLNPNSNYFQTRPIIERIYSHLRSKPVRTSIESANPFKERYGKNNDIHMHIRLGDAASYNPGILYYLKALSMISRSEGDTVYISTDQKGHPIIQSILQKYPSAVILGYDDVRTLQFASTCKNIVLSHGSFSAMIGYISYYSSSVTYPDYSLAKQWCGDMFCIDGWNALTLP